MSPLTRLLAVLVFPLALAVLTSASDWHIIDLPARPFNITENQGVLWVCGVDEFIAKSTDGGKTWMTQHQQKDGGILLNIAFSSPKFGYATGLGGTLLFTRDSGGSWSRTPGPDPVIYAASFSDDKHGLVHARHNVFVTVDGGQSWKPIKIAPDPDEDRPFTYVLSLHALDTQHMLVVMSEGNSGVYHSKYLITNDGGLNWKWLDIPSTGSIAIVTKAGEYWFSGHEVIEKDKPGGGYGVPLIMHSQDGEKWTHLPRWSQKEFSTCNPQGCLYWNGAGVRIPPADPPAFWAFPTEKSLSAKWAVAQGSICTVSTDLKCAAVAEINTMPPYTEASTHVPGPIAPPPLDAPVREGLQCLFCDYDHVLVTQNYQGLAELDLKFHIGANGLVQKVEVLKSPSGEVTDKILPALNSWIFMPYLKNGIATPVVTNIKLRVQIIKSR